MAKRPALSRAVSPQVRRAIDAVGAEAAATRASSRSGAGGAAGGGTATDSTFYPVPGPPRELTANGAFSSILLTWGGTGTDGVAHYEIFRSDTDNLAAALAVGTSIGFAYGDSPPYSGMGQTYYYWVRAVNKNNIAGPFNATAGTPGSTSDDPAYLLQVLSGQIKEGQLYQDLQARIDLIDMPETGLIDTVADTIKEQRRITVDLSHLDAGLRREETQLDAAAEGLISTLIDAAAERERSNLAVAGILEVQKTLGTDLSAEQSRVMVLAAQVEQARATIVQEQLVRASADGAEASIRTEIAARLTTAEATIISEQQARVDGFEAEAQARASLQVSFQNQLQQTTSDILAGLTPAYTWDFNDSVEGWTGNVATLTQANSDLLVDQTGAGAYLQKTGIAFDGGINTIVQIYLKRTAGTGWVGKLRWATDGHALYSAAATYAVGDVVRHDNGSGEMVWVCAGAITVAETFTPAHWTLKGSAHGFSDSYRQAINDPAADNNYHSLSISLREPVAGGSDWTDNIISGLQIFLGVDATNDFAVHSISVNKSSVEQTLFNDLGDRLLATEAGIDQINYVHANSTSATAKKVASLEATVTDASTGLVAAHGKITAIDNISVNSTSAAAQAIAGLQASFSDPATGLAAAQAAIGQINTVAADSDSAIAQAVFGLTGSIAADETGLPAAHAAIVEINRLDVTSTSVAAQKLIGLDAQVNDPVTGIAKSLADVQDTVEVLASPTTAEAIRNSVTRAEFNLVTDDNAIAVLEQILDAAEQDARLPRNFQRNIAGVLGEIKVLADADQSTASKIEGLYAEVAAARAGIAKSELVRTSDVAAEARRREELTAEIDTSLALAVDEMKTYADEHSAVAQSSKVLWAEALGTTGGYCLLGGAKDPAKTDALTCELAGGVWVPGDGSDGTLSTQAKTSAAIQENNVARVGFWKDAGGAVQAEATYENGLTQTGWTWHPAAAFAESTKQVQVLLPGGSYAAVADQMYANADDLGKVTAQRTIKTETRTSDGKMVVAGIGAMTNSDGDSEILLRAGRVAIVPDELDSSELVVPFVVVGGKVYMDTAMIRDATIKAAQIESLTAALVNAVEINAAAIKTGILSGINIISPDPGDPNPTNPSTGAFLDSGNLYFKKSGTIYKYLKQIFSGTLLSGQSYTLTNLDNAPEIMVSLRDLASYKVAYKDQDQRWEVRLSDVGVEDLGGGSYRFTPVANLKLGAASSSTPLNLSGAGVGGYTSPTQTSPANTTSITVNGTITSKQYVSGTTYNRRYCTPTLYWRVAGSGTAYASYVGPAIDHGADFTTDSFTISKSGLAAGSYEFYVSLFWSTNGTWTDSGDAYEYSSTTVENLVSFNTAGASSSSNTNASDSDSMSLPAPAYPTGYSAGDIYNVDYSAEYSWNYGKNWSSPTLDFYASLSGPGVNVSDGWDNTSGNIINIYSPGYPGYATAAWSAGVFSGTYGYGVTVRNGAANLKYRNLRATISLRKLKSGSTTAENTWNLQTATFVLSTAEIIDSTGVVNWIAIA